MVGVNRFTEGNQDDQIELLQITNEDEARQLKRLDQVRHDRDQAAVDAALARLAVDAADPELNLMPTLIDTVETYATLGEIMHTLGTRLRPAHRDAHHLTPPPARPPAGWTASPRVGMGTVDPCPPPARSRPDRGR